MPRNRRPSRPFVAAVTALTLCAGTAVALGATGPATAAEAAAAATDEPSLTGAGKLDRRPGDNVHFAIDAHGLGDKARGSFFVSHHIDDVWGGYFKGRIDCLLTGGPVAVATGVVTEAHFEGKPGTPQLGDLKGKRFGFTVLDGGKGDKGGSKDRLGYSWAAQGLPTTGVDLCQSSAPIETLAKGDFTVHHWLPARKPAQH
ncbi:hypothetical protein [Streptomyces sp. NPDC049555]|uniref:hypothetical protein n=1 Tax=unclassified Streptomyces TaxID=2593676 RepID=UPI003438F2BF